MDNKDIGVYQYGSTVRLECTFYNFENEIIDPSLVRVKVYDYKYNVILDEIGTKITTGKYLYDFVIPPKEQKLIYEWYGEIDGKPSIKRAEFIAKFV